MLGAHYGWWAEAWTGWHLIGSLGPADAAATVTAFLHGRVGVRRLLGKAVRWRTGCFPWTLAIGGPTLLLVAGLTAVRASGAAWPTFGQLTQVPEYSHLNVPVLLGAEILFYGFGEELGLAWLRLPRMATRSGLLLASLGLSVPWAVWHLPSLLSSDTFTAMGPALLGGWFFTLITGSVLLAFLFQVSRGSVLVVAVFHGLLDVAMVNAAVTGNAIAVQGAMVTIAGLVAAIWLWGSGRSSKISRPHPRSSRPSRGLRFDLPS